MNPEAATEATKQFDSYFTMAESVGGIDSEQLAKLKGILKEWMPMSTGVRGVFTAIAPGADGMFGLALVVDTANSGKWSDTYAGFVETAMKLPKEGDDSMDEDAKRALAAIDFKRDAETVAGAKVHQLKFDVAKAEEMDEEDTEKLHKILGADGFTLRTAAVGDDNVVMTFGGGSKYFATVVEQTKSKAAMLDGEPGIQAASKRMPRERAGLAYLDADRFVRWLGELMAAVEEDEEFPIKLPKLDAPIALVTTGGDGWQTSQLHIPSELMVATKDAVMGAMGGGDGGVADSEE